MCTCALKMARLLSAPCEEFGHLICMMSKITSGVMEQLDVNLSPSAPSLRAPCMNSDGNFLRLCCCGNGESPLPRPRLVSGREACIQESGWKKPKKLCRFLWVFHSWWMWRRRFDKFSLHRDSNINATFFSCVPLQPLDAFLVPFVHSLAGNSIHIKCSVDPSTWETEACALIFCGWGVRQSGHSFF